MKPFSPRPAGYTIEELSTIVGMSARNIRAHQTRGLLAPPVRHGRSAYYGPAHLRRLRRITMLQKQGFNLVSIAAMLGTTTVDRAEQLDAAMAEIARDQPAVARCLERHGVLGRDGTGSLAVVRPSVSRAVADLAVAGIPPVAALRFLGQFMDRVTPLAGDQLAALKTQVDGGSAAPRACFADLLVSAFKIAVENAAEVTFPVAEPRTWPPR
ncbi:MerR family transcriptional regulator [Amycolatopsis keratiniphila]|uniref:MerR family transcriptional regulator n=1 Tax=Amycolatopsis keratiniphila subsp. keratiniphila TaxID=227715 RepID=A0A1W2LKQ9_9PSEU|nr:MerR family transcriptional regulator [Amycolatopsis keratiniphila]ONF63479.1 MerR family transcriptional regulator [Amycolatopsis keratiniphila subsp. keratiniphila]